MPSDLQMEKQSLGLLLLLSYPTSLGHLSGLVPGTAHLEPGRISLIWWWSLGTGLRRWGTVAEEWKAQNTAPL